MGSAGVSLDGDLLAGDSPHLELVLATPEEHLETIRMNSRAWKGLLDLDQYIEREHRLSQQNLTKNGALTCWILVDGRLPPNSRTILSSCETYLKPAYLAYKGNVEEIICHGIGSVFARPEFRGRGYAGRMMEELSKKLDTWQSENQPRKQGVFSVLFSDIGKKFYTRYGWKPYLSSHMTLPPINEDHLKVSVALAKLPVARPMSAEDVRQSMCSEIVEHKQRNLLQVASQKSPGAKVAISPDYDHMLWHWARENYYVEMGVFDDKKPSVRGAAVDSQNVFCTWVRTVGDTKSSHTLHILRFSYDEPASPSIELSTIEAIAAVLRRAQFEAHALNVQKVEFWNPTSLVVKAAKLLDPDAQVFHRDESSICSLKWNGAKQGLGDDVEWFWNEKYSWC
ncbi:hypothetical protein BGW36DRAFT_296794 [Talaromyces proteolyticus]|uniref:LYC1 C-terminal domain-containing protein n=1 Tax=Talaromyces proteolyticus TaxID=1131652 RepID=A0AAD4KND9_9EURO|nr:uncharacterized protein BGW36DRAFT_296794 [Talaromyces proteolyticus]KAH8696642.1 hypothetical protein BGW36DRAFT_296794 [Talaromyces proteolyticus]